jgi:c-di-GMP-binding flagellar brake protein YcgR
MFQDTRPAELDPLGGPDPWAEFRVRHPQERLALLRQLRDGTVPVNLNGSRGASISCTLWTLDDARKRMHFSADTRHPQLDELLQGDEAVAVAYLESVKLQFDVQGLCLVRGREASTLQCALPDEIYRFQRRDAYRVRTQEHHGPSARLRHPGWPEMLLTLRVVDVSVGGCALWLPADVPALPPGTLLSQVEVRLDEQTQFVAALTLQHASALSGEHGGMRLGCAWRPLSGQAERTLQRWIDQAQKRRRLLVLD